MANTNRKMYYLIMFFVGLMQVHDASAEQVIGWVNSAKIYPEKIIVHARMDSGAKTSSLRGESIKPFSLDGKKWLRIVILSRRGHKHILVRKIVRFVKIKQHSGSSIRRPVVLLGICVGNVYKEAEATIVERKGFNYPLLIGRNFLAGNFFIDSERTFTAKPACEMKGN